MRDDKEDKSPGCRVDMLPYFVDLGMAAYLWAEREIADPGSATEERRLIRDRYYDTVLKHLAAGLKPDYTKIRWFASGGSVRQWESNDPLLVGNEAIAHAELHGTQLYIAGSPPRPVDLTEAREAASVDQSRIFCVAVNKE